MKLLAPNKFPYRLLTLLQTMVEIDLNGIYYALIGQKDH